jgi:hypothetical protein
VDIAVFHTGSHAEFHNPFLQRLLSKYVKEISAQHDSSYLDIMNNDAKFTDAVHKYKMFITHYLASKMEIWMNHFMQPVYGMTGGNTSMEFTKTRGAIHYHMASYSNHLSIAAMHDHLRICAENIADAMEAINQFITQNYKYSAEFPKCPSEIFNTSGFKHCAEFMDSLDSPDANKMWEDFIQIKEKLIDACGRDIGNEFESEFGLEAMHTGNFPHDWVKSGGLQMDGDYPATTEGMQSSADVLAQRELKQTKISRERWLYRRKSNIMNHAYTHKCSGYCTIWKELRQKYNPDIHILFGEYLKKFDDKNVVVISYECRMGFGELLK